MKTLELELLLCIIEQGYGNELKVWFASNGSYISYIKAMNIKFKIDEEYLPIIRECLE